LAGMLEKLGQDTRVAYDGETAIGIAAEQHPDVAFLDISMPGMNGVELGRRLRAEFPNGELSIVAVTGKSSVLRNEAEGIFDHRLLKPLTLDQLASFLHRLPHRRSK